MEHSSDKADKRAAHPSTSCRPQWNGCVERASRLARIEFRNRYDGPLTVSDIAPRLFEHEFFHNCLRPCTALDCRTPNEDLVQIEEAA